MEAYYGHFIKKELRRLDKIFKTMAEFVGTREAEQCRSHHQKMEKKFHLFPRILLYLRREHYATDSTEQMMEDLHKEMGHIPDLLPSSELYDLLERVEEKPKHDKPK